MPAPGPRTPRRYPEAVKRRLEVANALAWEALLETHAEQALDLVALLAGKMPFDEVVDRYIREMDLPAQLSTAVRTRALVVLEEAERGAAARPPLGLLEAGAPEGEEADGWRRFLPDAVVRGLQERQRRQEETERLIQLALARAEEAVIGTHIENALTVAALLEAYGPLARAVEEYIRGIGIYGGRAQAVFQRTMARLAEVHLPRPVRGSLSRPPAERPSDRR